MYDTHTLYQPIRCLYHLIQFQMVAPQFTISAIVVALSLSGNRIRLVDGSIRSFQRAIERRQSIGKAKACLHAVDLHRISPSGPAVELF